MAKHMRSKVEIPTFDEWLAKGCPFNKGFARVDDLTDEEYNQLVEDWYPTYEVEIGLLREAL